MAKLSWDQDGQRFYETGVDHGVIYPKSGTSYGAGVAWNGLTAVTERPSGGEANAIYADNIKYLNLRSNEDFGITIEAYTYPDEFAECDGSKDVVAGVRIGQQRRKVFGFSYQTRIGNDTEGDGYGYKIHLVYNCEAAPSEKNRQTVNESPEATSFSWEVNTTPVAIENGFRPCAHIEIDCSKFITVSQGVATKDQKLIALENMLYGTNASGGSEATDPTLPPPLTVFTTMGWSAS